MIGGKKRMEQGHSKKETGVISNFDQCNAKRQPGNMAGRNNAILGPSPPIWPIGENVPRVGCIAAALKNQQGPLYPLLIALFAKFFVAPATIMPYYVHTHEFCMVTRRNA